MVIVSVVENLTGTDVVNPPDIARLQEVFELLWSVTVMWFPPQALTPLIDAETESPLDATVADTEPLLGTIREPL
jgi:hypothetical protein